MIQEPERQLQELIGEIQKYLINSTIQKQEKYIHLSRLVRCLKKAFLEIKVPIEYKSKLSSATRMSVGSAYELWLKTIFENLGIALKDKIIEIATDTNPSLLIGRPDARIRFNGIKYLIEIKSVGKQDFATIVRKNKARWYDEKQLRFYLLFSKTQYGILWYINRYSYTMIQDNIELLRHKLFPIKREIDSEKLLLARYTRFLRYITENKIPKAEGENKDDEICRFCRFWNFCWGN